jgi:hypothetical protein
MPSLPAQHQATLAHALARQPTSTSDLLDGKFNPPADSKRVRRGAKDHLRRRSSGAPTMGVRKAATFAASGTGTATTPTTTAMPGEGSPGLHFMNFTMDNRDTIIKGVAPSGSGKTKLRRDREEAEKSRRLSEAVKAGLMGDFSQLEEVHRMFS